MKRRLLIIGIVVLLCGGAATLWTYRQRLFAPREVSETYIKYADRQDIEATFIKDFAVSDSVCTDITLLQATDTASWLSLFGDFNKNLKNLQEIPEQYKHLYLYEGLYIHCFPAGHPELMADSNSTDVEVAVIYKNTWTVMVCHTKTFEQTQSILRYQMKDYINNLK